MHNQAALRGYLALNPGVAIRVAKPAPASPGIAELPAIRATVASVARTCRAGCGGFLSYAHEDTGRAMRGLYRLCTNLCSPVRRLQLRLKFKFGRRNSCGRGFGPRRFYKRVDIDHIEKL